MPFSAIYGIVTDIRNSLFNRGVFKSHSLGAPTFSVGNITVGGTGKTPLVAFIAEILSENGEKVCILSRGYGRNDPKKRVLVSNFDEILSNPQDAGDEPFELAVKLAGKAIVVSDADRVSAAEWARGKFGITAFLLDDAFQHRRAQRDLDIVVIDATNPFGNRKTLPFGILREPLSNLRRADLIVISRSNLTDNVPDLTAEISNYNPHCPIIAARNTISGLRDIAEFYEKVEKADESYLFEARSKRTFAFCGLGNPGSFFLQLRFEGFDVAGTEVFRDHHFYSREDIKRIERNALKQKAEILLTTAKDAVKLGDLSFDLPCFVVENTLEFDNEKALREIIHETLNLYRKKS